MVVHTGEADLYLWFKASLVYIEFRPARYTVRPTLQINK